MNLSRAVHGSMHDFEETLAATNRSAAILAAETFCWSEIWKFRNVGHVELAAARMAAVRRRSRSERIANRVATRLQSSSRSTIILLDRGSRRRKAGASRR